MASTCVLCACVCVCTVNSLTQIPLNIKLLNILLCKKKENFFFPSSFAQKYRTVSTFKISSLRFFFAHELFVFFFLHHIVAVSVVGEVKDFQGVNHFGPVSFESVLLEIPDHWEGVVDVQRAKKLPVNCEDF